ncbi:Nicotianamine aminotransferase 1 [Linum grandiflorum]
MKKWQFEVGNNNKNIGKSSAITIRSVYNRIVDNLNKNDLRSVIQLGQGDPSVFSCFRPDYAVEVAVKKSLESANYNCYAESVGLLSARRAVAEYLNNELPYKLTANDVFMTVGCTQAIEVAITALARPGANILLPRPGYPDYEAFAAQKLLQVRHYDLLPDKGWDIDLEAVEAIADENTVAIAVINPGNPCGNVFSYDRLLQIAETARNLGILVIADEVYGHLTFGDKEFIPMGIFGSIVPVLTLGSLSKRWLVPGWRLGWLVATDPNRILLHSGIVDTIKDCVNISADPATLIQGAMPQILKNSNNDFYLETNKLMKKVADLCYDKFQDIRGISCPHRAEGAMFIMIKLNLSEFEAIKDDMDFCLNLSEEESVILIPGMAVGLKNWARLNFATDLSTMKVALQRIKAFCERHIKIIVVYNDSIVPVGP